MKTRTIRDEHGEVIDGPRVVSSAIGPLGVGDVCQLRSGGPSAVIVEITDGRSGKDKDAKIAWIDDLGHEHTLVVDVRCLS